MNIKPGDRFNAYSKGEEFIDPDTGLSLGSEETFIGAIEIKDVKEKFSIASLVSGKGMLKRGDIIKGGLGEKRYNISAAARPYFDRGKALYEKKDYKGAEAEYRKALKHEPNSPLYHNWLGVSLDGQGNYTEAISHYRRVLQSEPDDAVTRGNLAFDLRRTGKFEEAKKEYEAVLRINPNDKKARESLEAINTEAMFQKIISLEEKGDAKGAEKAFQEALKVIPNETQALFELDKMRANKIRSTVPKGQYGWLGTNIMVFSPEEREKYQANNVAGVPDGDIRGMLVTDVIAGSAAEAAGIQSVIRRPGTKGNNPEDFEKLGDIITEIDGQPALGNLLSLLATKKPGDTISLKVIRNGKPHTVTVTLKARPK
jgi:tetratricopeptide (TPR) repeat protein